jgi:glycosyltransferase involved in cell wall biosynthesis
MNIVAIIAAYNEEARIMAAVADALCFVDAVVVVDDCSQDATSEQAATAGAFVLRHVINRGQGAALQTATAFALQNLHPNVIVHFDADGQMLGSEIPMMIAPIVSGEADVVLGSRFLDRSRTSSMPFSRRLILKLGLIFTRLVSGIKTTDTHNGFRALSAHAAGKLRLTLDRMAHASEILDLIVVHDLRYVERPVTIRYSAETLAKGQSSLGSVGIGLDFLKKRFLG